VKLLRVLALVLLAAACGNDPPAKLAAPADPAPSPAAESFPRANVLLITIDTVRADRLGCYGYARPTTPHLDALAQRSVLFEQAFSASSFTPPAHASILTGLYPAEHGLHYWNKSLADVPTAADTFAAAGYATLAVTPFPTLLIIGLKRGFQNTASPEVGKLPNRDQLVIADADAVNAAALSYLLRKGDERPFFAWLHYYDAHRPYGRQGKEWSGRYAPDDIPSVGANEGWYQLTPERRRDLNMDARRVQLMKDHYDGGLSFLDDRLGKLFDQLEQAGRLANTIVLVVADHGECFDEHEPEWFAHDPYLYEENVHIPLLLHLPGDAHAGLHVKDLVSQVDLLPTLLQLAGVAPLDQQRFSGTSLVPALAGHSLQRSFVFADRQGDDLSLPKDGQPPPTPAQVAASRDRLFMLRTPTRKLLIGADSGQARLFDLSTPDGESQDLSQSDPQGFKAAFDAYTSWEQSLHPAGESGNVLTPEQQKQIESIGYAGAKSHAPPPPPGDEKGPPKVPR
jgi:arylsulfatase A-like enzyme